jgi:type I restriction enzyme S subunit
VTTFAQLAARGSLIVNDGYRTKVSELGQPGYPVLRVAEVGDGRIVPSYGDHVRSEYRDKIGYKLSRAGDVLLTTKGTVGRRAIMPSLPYEFAYSPQLCFFRSLDGSIDNRWLYYWLGGPDFWRQATSVSQQTDMAPYISLSDLRAIELELPPIEEQREIAATLGVLDDKIESNDRLIFWLTSLCNSEFDRRFGYRRLSLPLGSVASVVDCLHSKKPVRAASGPRLMQLNNIRDDGLVDSSETYVIEEADYRRWSHKFETQPWDCVITNVGRIGAVARIPSGFTAALGRNMTGIRPTYPDRDGAFLATGLISPAVRREIELRTDSGTIMNALNVRSIPHLRLPESSVSDRAEFHQTAAPLLERADHALAESLALKATRDALLPLLLSRQVRAVEVRETVEKAVR